VTDISCFKFGSSSISACDSAGRDHQETQAMMTLGNTMNAEDYRDLAAEEAALAKAAVSNASRHALGGSGGKVGDRGGDSD
jgi:hypothetical protein